MEEKRLMSEERVGIGAVLSPGSYSIEGEELLLRVRLKGTSILCLIDGERRVKEIDAAPPAGTDFRPSPPGEIAFDASRARESKTCPENQSREHAAAVGPLVEKFAAAVQRFAGDGRACLRKMSEVLAHDNPRLVCEFAAGGPAGLKAHLIREFFKRTVREERGFKVLLFLSHVIAFSGSGQPERLEAMSLEQQKQLLKEFMDFLKVPGHKRVDPRIFREIHDKFNEQEYANLSHGGVGFFIKPLYDREMQELKSAVINSRNSNYIEQMYINSNREPVDFLYENTLAYLKALAIVRLYARSNKKERGGDGKVVEHIIRDLITFRPSWVRTAEPGQARSA